MIRLRRLDRRLLGSDRLEDDDPRLALSGVDKIEARRFMAAVGFDCIVDAGLARTAGDFDRYRVTVFDPDHSIDRHFDGQQNNSGKDQLPDGEAYDRLEAQLGRCGAAEIAGASVAAPYVSAVAASVAVSRVIAVTSGCACPSNQVARISALRTRKLAPAIKVGSRGIRHGGRPGTESG